MRKLMSAAAAALLISAAGVSGAHAQTAAPAAAAAETATPAKMALIARLDKAMNFDTMMSTMMGNMMPALIDAQRKAHPEITDAQVKTITDITVSVTQTYVPKMKAAMYQAYAETFTEDELKSIVDFYESPNGQAVLHKMPAVMQKAMPAITAMIPQMQADMMQQMCEKLKCPAQPAKAN